MDTKMAASTTADYEGSIQYPAELLEGSCGCAIDIGGSMIKLAFIDKDQTMSPGMCTIRQASFKPSDLPAALSYILEHCAIDTGAKVITTTGVGVTGQVIQVIEDRLKLKVDKIVETPPMFTAFFDLAKTRELEELTLAIPTDVQNTSLDFVRRMGLVEVMLSEGAEDWTNEYARMTARHSGIPSAPPLPHVSRNRGRDGDGSGTSSEVPGSRSGESNARGSESTSEGAMDTVVPLLESHPHLFPCMISSLGSGCSMTKLYVNGRAEPAGGSNRAGRTLMGLSSLLIGVSNYDELCELASRGDATALTMHSRDLKPPRPPGQPEDSYDVWPDDLRIFSFGKAQGKTLSNQSKEDVARALLCHVCDDVGMTYYLACRARACRALFVSGGFVEHQVVRDILWSCFNGMNAGPHDKIEMYFLKEGWFYPAIGCLRHNAYKCTQTDQ